MGSKRKKRLRLDRLLLVLTVFAALAGVLFALLTRDEPGKMKQSGALGSTVGEETPQLPAEPAMGEDNTRAVYLFPSDRADGTFADESTAMRALAEEIRLQLAVCDIAVLLAPAQTTITDAANMANQLGIGTFVALYATAGTESDARVYYAPDVTGSRTVSKAVYDAVVTLTDTATLDLKSAAATKELPMAALPTVQTGSCMLELQAEPAWLTVNTERLAAQIVYALRQYQATLPAIIDTETGTEATDATAGS